MAIGGLSYGTGSNENTGSGSSSSTLNNGANTEELERLRWENAELRRQVEALRLAQASSRIMTTQTLGAITSDQIDALPEEVRIDLRARIRVLFDTMIEDFAQLQSSKWSEASDRFGARCADLFTRCGVPILVSWGEKTHRQWNDDWRDASLSLHDRCYAWLMSTRWGGGDRRVRDERVTTMLLVGEYLGSFVR